MKRPITPNREMLLVYSLVLLHACFQEDGRFIMNHKRYDQLLARVDDSLIRCHPLFRVVAIGVPVPPFQGFSLDPPVCGRSQTHPIRS